MSDIEDGIENRIITYDDVFSRILKYWQEACVEKSSLSKDFANDLVKKSQNQDVIDPFVAFKTSAITLAVEHAADVYVRHHDAIISGIHAGLMEGESDISTLLNVLKRIVRKTVFRCEAAESVELAGYRTIFGLLNRFSELLTLSSEDFRAIIEGRRVPREDHAMRLANRLSDKSLLAYKKSLDSAKNAQTEWHLRAHLLVDHMSGMTDQYAVRTHQLLEGIRIAT